MGIALTRKHLAIWVGVMVSVGALVLAFWGIDFSSLKAHLATANWAITAVLLLVYWLHFVVRAKRWQILLRPIRTVGFKKAFGPMLVGFFGNNVLPAHMGEFARMYVGAKKFAMTNAQVLATLVVERVMDFAAVAVLFGIGLGLAPIATEGLASLGYAITVAAIAGMALIGIYVRYQNRSRGFIAKLVQPLPEHLGEWLMRNVDAFGEGLGATANTWQLVRMSLQSLLIWLMVTAAIHLSLLAVGMRLPFDASLLLLGATVFAVTLPAAPGFFGTFQLAYVLALKPYGIDNESAVAASIVFHLPVYFSVTFVGMLIVGRLGMSWQAVKHEAEEIEESGVTKIIGNAEGRPVK
jgi:uncharacterized protein (TIRG00374 family)